MGRRKKKRKIKGRGEPQIINDEIYFGLGKRKKNKTKR